MRFCQSSPIRVVLCAATIGVGSLTMPTAAHPAPPGAADDERPSLSLRASPATAFSPVEVLFFGDLTGGPDDYEEFYCATVEWDWGDGTRSSTTADCEPYEPDKSQIRRRYPRSPSLSPIRSLRNHVEIEARRRGCHLRRDERSDLSRDWTSPRTSLSLADSHLTPR